MGDENYIIGCFASTNMGDEQGVLFRTYIWGDKGIGDVLKALRYEDYGNDMKRILFQFYVNPIPYERQNLKEIEPYRAREKAIGVPIIVTHENFFSKSEEERYSFLKQTILQKLDLLAEVVKKKKLDTKIDLLKADLQKFLN
ncbi:hypothetical protein [Sphingobacterium sp. UME9]|uniref:hypothetical protein n=1 Tax=Sphingobacterium sp. UME9 TaxID=1862316 RepID=UPI00160042FA|nr:hypothetical protein [Sphingobacterium sp. UME9]MBB1646776.1 hypothetical protein [Sphingobacterium sp. UME9]